METLRQLLEAIIKTDGIDLYLKTALSILVMLMAIAYPFVQRRMRKQQAERNKERDRINNTRDNDRIEEQHAQDGASVRDRLRR